MFFDSWTGLVRVVTVGVLAYAALVAILRISGNRTLSKMNAFDLIVTVALGSTLATILLSRDVALAEGIVALALLVGLQFAVTWLSVRFPLVSHAVKSEPTLLLHRGAFLPEQMRQARVVEAEVLAALREQGIAAKDGVAAVVLETDGTFSVVKEGGGQASALANVPGLDRQGAEQEVHRG